jgi:hypothetical protein
MKCSPIPPTRLTTQSMTQPPLQVQNMLLSKIPHYNQLIPEGQAPPPTPDTNVFLRGPPREDPELDVDGVARGLDRRLDLPFHQAISAASTVRGVGGGWTGRLPGERMCW